MKRRVHRVAWWRCDRVADYGARPAASWQSPSDWCVCSRFCADARTICDGISQQLNTLGYAEGTDYVLLVRWGEGNFDRFSDYARELVEAGPDVILAIGTAVANAVKGQTSTIPAIFVQVADPIGGGFVKSLSRPGSNFTGFANYEPGMVGKWSGSHVQSADNIRGRCTFLGSI